MHTIMRTLFNVCVHAYDEINTRCLRMYDALAALLFFVQVIVYGILRAVLLPALLITIIATTLIQVFSNA